MSWANELTPEPLTPLRLVRDLLKAEQHYRAERVPAARRIAFLAMRLGQRAAYWAGWTASAIEERATRSRRFVGQALRHRL